MASDKTSAREMDVAELLARAGAALADQSDQERMVQAITDLTVELTGAEFGAFFCNVDNDAGESYMLYTLSGVPRENFSKFPMPRNTAIFAPTFGGERAVRYADVTAEPAYGKSAPYHGMPPGHLPVRSYLAVSVVSRSGAVHGGLFFGHAKTGVFTERDETIVNGIAALAATALDNARLFRSSQRSRDALHSANVELEERVAARVEDIRQREAQFDRLISGIADYAIFMLDTEGNVQTWNTGAERIKGYLSDEIVGRNFSVFYTPEDRAAGVPATALRTAREQGRFEIEAWRLRKDGSRFFANVVVDAIHGPDGELLGFAKITRDMTERRILQEQLLQAQKMEAIGQLTGGVAHDFNNLLTVIIGNLDIIAREPESAARRQRAVDQALRGAQRAATLTQQLLAFSRRQPLNPKPTDINKLITGAADLLRPLLGESISIEAVLSGGLWLADLDAHQLESALLNLALNARDAMPHGGKLTIEAGNAHIDELYRKNYAEITTGQYVLICVTDTGMGMPKDVLDHAFEPFYTTKPVGEGTGLGLSQVYGFVKQSGGHVKIYTEIDQGTTVKMYFPRVPESRPTEANAAKDEPVPRGTETILLVEDDADVRSYSVETLRELGFHVIEAGDGMSALNILMGRSAVDLLFTDVGLPGLNGRQLAERARQLRPELRVLFTTGYARNAIVHQGRLDEGVELLTKPYSRERLASRVRDVLDSVKWKTKQARVALVVEDEPLLREVVAYVLKSLGFRIIEAGSAAQAHTAIAADRAIDVAIIDVSLPDGEGIGVVHALRKILPQLPILMATGAAAELDAATIDPDGGPLHILAKPYSLQSLTAALDVIGVGRD